MYFMTSQPEPTSNMCDYITWDSHSSGTTFHYLEVKIDNDNNKWSTSDDEDDAVVGDACIVPFLYDPLPKPRLQPNSNPQLQTCINGR